jgi:hypothetical protein
MFDDLKDVFAKQSIARLQKRIDTLRAYQEMLDKLTPQRGLNELEHYRLELSIGVALIAFFGAWFLCSITAAFSAEVLHGWANKMLVTLLFLGFAFVMWCIWHFNLIKTLDYWRAASPINRASLQRRIEILQQALTQSMAKRFRWDAKPSHSPEDP